MTQIPASGVRTFLLNYDIRWTETKISNNDQAYIKKMLYFFDNEDQNNEFYL